MIVLFNWALSHWSLLLLIVITPLVLLWIGRVVYQAGAARWSSRLEQSFYQSIEREIGLTALSSLVVTVYVRAKTTRLLFNHHANLTRTEHDYAERLIVVSPHNWMIYTNNGIHFYFISSAITLPSDQCDPDRSLPAIEYRLLAADENTIAQKLRFACIHYNYDQLIRIFARSADKTSYDLADFFDKKKNNQAPDLTIDEILDLLIINSVI